MRNLWKPIVAIGAFLALATPVLAGSNGHGVNAPDLGAIKPEQAKVDPAVLATGERAPDLSDMTNDLPVR